MALNAMMHALVGCRYGHDFQILGPTSMPQGPCWAQASRRVAVHFGPGHAMIIQVCPQHASLIMEETTTREGEDDG
jgi:hypothetical protein